MHVLLMDRIGLPLRKEATFLPPYFINRPQHCFCVLDLSVDDASVRRLSLQKRCQLTIEKHKKKIIAALRAAEGGTRRPAAS